MAAYRNQYITLGGLNCGTMAIDCYDWSSLLGSPTKRGDNRTIPYRQGREVRPRVIDQHRAGLGFRLRGDYNTNNAFIPSTEEAWHTNIYARLNTLRQVCDFTGTQILRLHYGNETLESLVQVEEMGAPNFKSPWIATLVVDVTLPNGPLGS